MGNKSEKQIAAAEEQIRELQRDVDYQVREYPIEVVVQKHFDGREDGTNELFVPDYQRDLVWDERNQSRFIESLLIGLPIPYVFAADVSSGDEEVAGRLEIVDGTQRIRTLTRFLKDELQLSGLEKLTDVNGFKFSDLAPSRQRRFGRITLRMIELTEQATEETRRDMFDRINTGAERLNAMETRRGTMQGPFIQLVHKMATNPLFHQLAPISPASLKRFEREELVNRFFAFFYGYDSFGTDGSGKVVSAFVDSFTEKMNAKLADKSKGTAVAKDLESLWQGMLKFVQVNYPFGFAKSAKATSTPRVRFEALAVGSAQALKKKPTLQAENISSWLDSPEFKKLTTSDAANNRSRVVGRIEYVRDKLLGK
jgi:hypothetical protein